MQADTSRPQSSQNAPSRLRARVTWALFSVFLVFVVLRTAALWYRHDESLREGLRQADTLSIILTEHLRRSIDAIDAALVQLALHSERVGGPKADAATWTSMLNAAFAGTSGISSLGVLDENGTITASTIPEVVGRSRADLPMFQELKKKPQSGIVTDKPFAGRLTGRILIALGRPLRTPDGRFAGIVIATLEPVLLRDFYRSVYVGTHGVISVFHAQGAVLFREPSAGNPTGQSARDTPLFIAQQKTPGAGQLRGPIEPDGPAYLSSYRTLTFPSIVVAVSLAEADVLASWRQELVIAAGVAIILAAALILAGWLISREITRRMRTAAQLAEADTALRMSRERFQAVMDHAPLLVGVKDLDGRYIFINRTATDRIGVDATGVLGKTPYEVFTKEDADEQIELDKEVMATKAPAQREVVIHYKSGPRTMLVIKFPLIGNDGKVEAIGSIAVDVSQLRQAEVQLAHAQKMDAVGQLTGGIAHDFNNLLTAILLNADVLADRITDEKLRPLAEATRMAAERGADLTRRLLAFGRRQTLEPRPTDVNVLVHNMEHLMRRTLGEHIIVEIKAAADLWPARIDPGQLEAAVVNLAVNARDAMPQGGRISIETANVELDADYAVMNPDVKPGEYVMIAVGDSGTGMVPDVVARAFEPFFTTKDVGKGTGLGLSMVYGFVKQSGGHVRIYSELGIGTIVRLYLPRADAPPVNFDALPARAAELPTGDETILLVEDDALVRAHTAAQLTALGCRVTTAENAERALEEADVGLTPDLLFTDIVMPGAMNGFHLAQHLRQRWPRLRVLYMSGFADGAAPLDRQVASRYMLSKPFRRRDLATKVRDILDEPVATAPPVPEWPVGSK